MNNVYNLSILLGLIFISGVVTVKFEDNQDIFSLFYLDTYANSNVMAVEDEEKNDFLDEKICNKLFDSETCQKFKVEELPDKDSTKQDKKTEEIMKRYFEPSEDKKPEEIKAKYFESAKSESSPKSDSELTISNGSQLGNEVLTAGTTNDSLSETGQTFLDNQSDTNETKNLNNLNQKQLVDLISSEISNLNSDVEKNKIVQTVNSLIQGTEAKGGNVTKSLIDISTKILKDPSGNLAQKIVKLAKTK